METVALSPPHLPAGPHLARTCRARTWWSIVARLRVQSAPPGFFIDRIAQRYDRSSCCHSMKVNRDRAGLGRGRCASGYQDFLRTHLAGMKYRHRILSLRKEYIRIATPEGACRSAIHVLRSSVTSCLPSCSRLLLRIALRASKIPPSTRNSELHCRVQYQQTGAH